MQMRKKVETPLVTLTVEGHWSADEDGTFIYTILENIESSTWDWIGLYKVRGRQRKKEVDGWTKTQKETKGRSVSQSGSLTSGDLYLCVQIGFKSASDYSTFAWVKDDEVAANGEVVTVWQTKSFSVENRSALRK